MIHDISAVNHTFYAKVPRADAQRLETANGPTCPIFGQQVDASHHSATDTLILPLPSCIELPEVHEGEDPEVAFSAWVSSLEWEVRHALAQAEGSMTFGQLRTALQRLLGSEHQWDRLAAYIAVDSNMNEFLDEFPHVLRVGRIGTSCFAKLC